MEDRRKLWRRGLTRLYTVLVGLWLLYFYLWVPLEIMGGDSKAAAVAGHPFDDRLWATKYIDIIFTQPPAWFHLLIVIAAPALGYLILRMLLALVYWVVNGFRKEQDT